MKKIIALISSLFLTVCVAYAQYDYQFSHQKFNRLLFNPAATGQSNFINASLLHRSQWVGFDNAPRTQDFTIHKFLNRLNFGLGLSLTNDRLGEEMSQNLKLSYAYHIWLSDNMILSFGLAGGALIKTLDQSSLVFSDMNEPAASFSKETHTKPDFDFGIELTTPHLILGASATHLFTGLNKADLYTVPRHYHAYIYNTFDITNTLQIKPSVSYSTFNRINMIEVNAMAIYNQLVWLGALHRIDDVVAVYAGVEFMNRFRIGYAYDIGTGVHSNHNRGTHEVMLAARLGRDFRLHSPRFFD